MATSIGTTNFFASGADPSSSTKLMTATKSWQVAPQTSGLEIANIASNHSIKPGEIQSITRITYLGTINQSLRIETVTVAGLAEKIQVTDFRGLLSASFTTNAANATIIQFLPRSLPRIGTEYTVYLSWRIPVAQTTLSELNLSIDWTKQSGLTIVRTILSAGFKLHNSSNPFFQIRAIDNTLEMQWATLRQSSFSTLLDLEFVDPTPPASSVSIIILLLLAGILLVLGLLLSATGFLLLRSKDQWLDKLTKLIPVSKSSETTDKKGNNHTKKMSLPSQDKTTTKKGTTAELELELEQQIIQVEQALLAKYEKLLKANEFQVFELLVNNPIEFSQQDLCNQTGISKATMSRIVVKLELKGLVSRQTSGMSKRVKLSKKFIDKEIQT